MKKQIKKIVAVIMTLAMMVSLLPGNVTIVAEETSDEYVTLRDEIGHLNIGDYYVGYDEVSNMPEGISYDAQTNTITLNNCNLNASDYYDGFINYSGDIPLYIVVKGTNNFTALVYEDEEDQYYVVDAISSYDNEGGENSVYISGEGTLNINNCDSIIYCSGYGLHSNVVSIDGVTINSNGGGIYNECGKILINNANVNIENDLGNGEGIRLYSYLEEADEAFVSVNNSNVIIKNAGNYSLVCRTYDLQNENIYIGEDKAERLITADELFEDYWGDGNLWCVDGVNYLSLSPNGSGDVTETTTPKPTEPEVTTPETTTPKPTEKETTTPKPTEKETTTPKPTEKETTTPKPTEKETTTPKPTEKEEPIGVPDGVDYLRICEYWVEYDAPSEMPEGVSYDKTTNTITLDNCNLGSDTYTREIITYSGKIPLYIVIKGNNYFTTALFEYENGGQGYMYDAIQAFLNGDGNNSVYISGDGTLNIKNCERIIYKEGNKDNPGVISIDGVTINSTGGGIYNGCGEILINNSRINIENTLKEDVIAGIGFRFYTEEGQKAFLSIKNSDVLIKNGSYSSIVCISYDFSGEYIYTGNGKAEKQVLANKVLAFYAGRYESNRDLNYLYFSSKKINGIELETETPKPTTKPVATKSNAQIEQESLVKVMKKANLKLKKAQNVKGKKVKLTWKISNKWKYEGYQIMYAQNKKFTKGKKITTAKWSATSKTIKGLKKKKTYYFKVRPYQINFYTNKKVYGSWSKVKKVKIKK